MSLTEKSSAQPQGHIEREASGSGEYMAEESSKGRQPQVEYEQGESPDPESDEEYDELDEDEDADSMSSRYEPLTGSLNKNQTFSESFQRYTSLPAQNAPSSSTSSSQRKIHTSIPAAHTGTLPDGTAINTLPSLRSLPIHPLNSHHIHESWRAHVSHRPPSPHHRYHLNRPYAYELPPPSRRSPSPDERPRRNSVMRLENILNSTSVDIASHIPRPHSAGDTRHASHPWSSELVRDPMHKETATQEQPKSLKEYQYPARRSDFRVISGWDQSRDPGRGIVEDEDDADSASVTSTEGLSTMDVDVDMDTPPPMSASTSTMESASVSGSSTAPFHESSGGASSSKSTTVKPKRKVKMHPCPECHKEFPRPSGLKTHMTIHTKEKPFACAYPGCTRAFSVVSNAKRHMRSHGITSDPSNPNNTLAFDANSPFAQKKNKERVYMVDFDEPVIVDSSPPINTTGGASAKGGLTLKWPAKGMEMVEGDASGESNGHGTGAMVGSHRGSGKRASSSGTAHTRTGSYGGMGARATKGEGGLGTR